MPRLPDQSRPVHRARQSTAPPARRRHALAAQTDQPPAPASMRQGLRFLPPRALSAIKLPIRSKRDAEQLAGVGIFPDKGHSAIETIDSHRSIPTSGTAGADLLREGQAGAKKPRP